MTHDFHEDILERDDYIVIYVSIYMLFISMLIIFVE